MRLHEHFPENQSVSEVCSCDRLPSNPQESIFYGSEQFRVLLCPGRGLLRVCFGYAKEEIGSSLMYYDRNCPVRFAHSLRKARLCISKSKGWAHIECDGRSLRPASYLPGACGGTGTYDLEEHLDLIRIWIWYDCYVFGSTDIDCPWDAIRYVAAPRKRIN